MSWMRELKTLAPGLVRPAPRGLIVGKALPAPPAAFRMAAIAYPGFGAFVVEGDPALAPPFPLGALADGSPAGEDDLLCRQRSILRFSVR